MRCDVGREVGTGHLSRCRALASWLEDVSVGYVVAADGDGRELAAGCPELTSFSLDLSEGEEVEWWARRKITADAIVFDLSYPRRVARRQATLDLVGMLGGAGARRILIDGIGSQTLVTGGASPVDVVVAPYAGANKLALTTETLAGAKYFPLPRSHCRPPARDPLRPVRRVLVTMGGSDPRGLTLIVLDALKKVHAHWTIDVVIGPAFTRSLAEAIRARALADERIKVAEAPTTLGAYLAIADLAVTATGLTKYEAAFAGVPCVQISIDRLHAELNSAFAQENTALHVGAAETVTVDMIAAAISELAGDVRRRAEMGQRGRALVDGQGGARIADKIRALIDVAS
jgi:spore coat polysaccharide biosynthesis protein SpsF